MAYNDAIAKAWYPKRTEAPIFTASSGEDSGNKKKCILCLVVVLVLLAIVSAIVAAVLLTRKSPQPTPPPKLRFLPPLGELEIDGDMTFSGNEFTKSMNTTGTKDFIQINKDVCTMLNSTVEGNNIVDSSGCNVTTVGAGCIRVKYRMRFKKKIGVSTSSGDCMKKVGRIVVERIRRRGNFGRWGFLYSRSVRFQSAAACEPNPCKNGGVCINNGDSYECQCTKGFAGRKCDSKPEWCYCSGDPHCHTFDDAMMDFQSTCRYTLVEALDKSFKISGRNVRLHGNPKVAFARWIEIKAGADKVRLGKLSKRKLNSPPQAMVNGAIVAVPYSGADYKIYDKNGFLEYLNTKGVIMSYKDYYYQVGLPEDFKEKVQGFCGNYDGLRNNDFITKDGVPLKKKIKSGYKIGNSWLEEEDPEDMTDKCSDSPDEVEGIEGTGEEELISKCPKRNLKRGKTLCGLLKDVEGVFGPCLKILDAVLLDNFVEQCVEDVEQTCSENSAFRAFGNLVLTCEQVDNTIAILVEGWEQKINATEEYIETEKCENGMIELKNAPSCLNTCQVPDKLDFCNLPLTPKLCACPSSHYFFRGNCIRMEKCGCIDEESNERNIGETWLNTDCSKMFTCQYGGVINETLFTCSKNCEKSQCTACAPENPCNQGICTDSNNSTDVKCECNPGFVGEFCNSTMDSCVISGVGNYKSFDGKLLKFRRSRRIVLVKSKSPEFKIYGKSRGKAGKKNAATLKSLCLEKDGKKIEIKKSKQTNSAPFVLKNGEVEIDFPFEQDGIKVSLFADKIQLIVGGNANGTNGSEPLLIISFSSKFRASIQLSPSLKGSKGLTGFCGNYNGDANDDDKSENGTVLTDDLLGESFLDLDLTDIEDTMELIDVNATFPDCGTFINLDKYLKLCQEFIDTSSAFGVCAQALAEGTVTAANFSASCEFDVNMTCDGSMAIAAAFSFSETCAEKGIQVNVTEIMESLNITQKCSNGLELAALVSPCIATCSDLDAPIMCELEKVSDVCVCPPGQVLFLGACVSQFECGCTDENGGQHKLGEIWGGDNCTIMYTCGPDNVITNTPFDCLAPKSCINNQCTACTDKSCSNGECIDSSIEPFFVCKCFPRFYGENCSTELLTSMCGGPGYFLGFDGHGIQYHGTARFLLTGNSFFKVFLRMKWSEDDLLVIRYVEVIIKGARIKFKIINGKFLISFNGKENINIPSDFGNFQLLLSGDFYMITFNGFTLKISAGGSIIIQIASELCGDLDGILGNGNGNATDDLVTKNGTYTNSTDEIGNSYAVPDPGEGEYFIIGLVDNSTDSTDKQKFCFDDSLNNVALLCTSITDMDGVFGPCLSQCPQNILDFYASTCESTILGMCNLERIQELVKLFSVQCSLYINITIDFATDLNINTNCADPNKVFMSTARACPATCEDPEQSQPCTLPDAINACMCPAGTVLYMDECIAPDNCGCIDNSTVAHKIDEVWVDDNCAMVSTCTAGGIIKSDSFECKFNKSCDGKGNCVSCKNDTCSANSVCKETQEEEGYVCECPITEGGKYCEEKIGSCRVFGNYHFQTFDGEFLSFSSECEVVLLNNSVGNESFSVSIFGNKNKDSNAIKIRQVVINVQSKVIKIGSEKEDENFKILVDDEDQMEFPIDKDDFKIGMLSTTEATLETRFNMRIKFGMLSNIEIFLPSKFGGSLEGMCGNFNGDASDDIVIATNAECDNSTTNETLPCDQPVPVACSLIADITGVFRECLNTTFTKEDMATFAMFCEQDYNTTCDERSVLDIVLAMAVQCQETINKTIDFCEALSLNCSEMCTDEHVSFVSSISSCPVTCKNTDASIVQQTCTTPPEFSICACNEGYVLHNGQCINKYDCGCYTNDGHYKHLLDQWIDETCTTKFMCDQDAQVIVSNFTCPENKTCVNGTCTSCIDDPCNGGECSDIPDGTFVCRCKRAGPQGTFCNETSNSTTAMILFGGLISTFDGSSFSFNKVTKFIFVQSEDGSESSNFKVFVKCKKRKKNSKIVVLDYVSVEYEGYRAKIKMTGYGRQGKLKYKVTKIDGGLVGSEASEYFIFIIQSSGISLKTQFNFTITVTQSGTIIVEASKDFKGSLKGLAGNNDGNSANDLITQDGIDLSHLTSCGEILGLEFAVDEIDEEEILLNLEVTSNEDTDSEEDEDLTSIDGEEPTLPDGCNEANLNISLALCTNETFNSNPLIAECFGSLDEKLQKFALEICAKIILEDCDSSTFLDVVMSMSEACLFTEPEVPEIPFDLLLTFSKVDSTKICECPHPSMKCMVNVISCLPTCKDPNALETCILPNSTFGCVCPPGLVFFAGECIPPKKCGCVDDTGKERMLQENWLTTDCLFKKSCDYEGETSLIDFVCPDGTACDKGTCSACILEPCKNGGTCQDIITINSANTTLNATDSSNDNGTINFKCFCTEQFKGETCEEKVIMPKCQVIGSSNIVTFDGLAYHYEGPEATYLIMASADFSLPNNSSENPTTDAMNTTTTNITTDGENSTTAAMNTTTTNITTDGENSTTAAMNTTTTNITTDEITNSTKFAIFAVNQVENKTCGLTSIVKSVNIFYGENVVILRAGDHNVVVIEVNGLIIEPPYFGLEFKITVVAGAIVFKGDNHLGVNYDATVGSLIVILPGDSNETTQGICGNHDNIIDNDVTFSNGASAEEIADFISKFTFPNIIIGSNQDNNTTNNVENVTVSNKNSTGEKPSCSNNTGIDLICEYILQPNNSFSQCLKEQVKGFDHTFVSVCKNDSKIFGLKSSACNYLEMLSKICVNFDLGDWRIESDCGVPIGTENENGLIWLEEVSSCQSTCTNPHADKKCKYKKKRKGGWGCGKGKVNFKSRCVNLMNCGCKDKNGVGRKKGESWSNGNGRQLKCKGFE